MFEGAALPNIRRITFHYKVLADSTHAKARNAGRPNQLESNTNLDIINARFSTRSKSSRDEATRINHIPAARSSPTSEERTTSLFNQA
jgi:hypothetical protein